MNIMDEVTLDPLFEANHVGDYFSDECLDVLKGDCMWSCDVRDDNVRNTSNLSCRTGPPSLFYGSVKDTSDSYSCSLFPSPLDDCFFDILSFGEEGNSSSNSSSMSSDYSLSSFSSPCPSSSFSPSLSSPASSPTALHSCTSSPLSSPIACSPTNSSTNSLLGSPKTNSNSKMVKATKPKSMYPERRKEHNNSEKKRRDHLRNAFDCLREQIPRLKDKEKKAARVIILKEATSYVAQLKDKARYLERTKSVELSKKDVLLRRLRHLQSGGVLPPPSPSSY